IVVSEKLDSPGVLTVDMYIQMELKGHAPKFYQRKIARQRARFLHTLHAALHDLRMSARRTAIYMPTVPQSIRTSCTRCQKALRKAFTPWRRRYSCEACGEVSYILRKANFYVSCRLFVVRASNPFDSGGFGLSPHLSIDDGLRSALGSWIQRQYTPELSPYQVEELLDPIMNSSTKLSSESLDWFANLHYLEELAQQNLQKVLDDQQTFAHGMCLRQQESCQVYQNGNGYQARTRINTSMHDAIALFTNDPVPLMEDIVDSSVVHQLSSNMSIRWMTMECAKPFRNRDFCIVQVQDHVSLPSGFPAYVISQHSIRLPGCPELESTLSIVRGAMYNCWTLITQTEKENEIEIRVQMDYDYKGRMPIWLQSYMVKQRILRLETVHIAVESFQLKASFGESKVPKEARSTCFGCKKSFHSFFRQWRRKHNCFLCGEIFCRQCTKSCENEPDKRVCKSCVSSMVEYSLRSPYTSQGSTFDQQTPLFDDMEMEVMEFRASGKTSRQYHPSLMCENFMELIDPPQAIKVKEKTLRSEQDTKAILFPTQEDNMDLLHQKHQIGLFSLHCD
ncbi:hypothetical protein THRCLA_09319, partial [Thraustotheca clavata]